MYNVLSLGAGVQSSTLAMMYAKKELSPMPDFAVFADTQGEPKAVYEWLAWLEKQLPYPVYKISKGNLKEDALRVRTSKKTGKKYIQAKIPFHFLKDEKGKGFLTRGCTLEYKIQPMDVFVRKMCKVKRGEKNVVVNRLIGISTDEITRINVSKNKWDRNVYPLIENNLSRDDCLEYFKKNKLNKPPKSACIFCPYHSKSFWSDLKKNSPEEFQEAVEYEKQAKIAYKKTDWWEENFDVSLHSSGNLETFDKKKETNQLDLFDVECEGMCGV